MKQHYEHGSKITLRLGESVIHGEVASRANTDVWVAVRADGASNNVWYDTDLWDAEVHHPEPTLPTKAGIYLPYSYSNGNGHTPNVWLLTPRGHWYELPNSAPAATRVLEPERVLEALKAGKLEYLGFQGKVVSR